MSGLMDLAFPPIVVEPAPLQLAAPDAQLPVPVSQTRLPAVVKSESASAIAVARDTSDTFVKKTGKFGYGTLAPVHRWSSHSGETTTKYGLITSFGAAVAGAAASMAGFIPFAPELFLAGGVMLPMLTFIGVGSAQIYEEIAYRGRTLRTKDVQPLRDRFDAETTTPLQKAVVGIVAKKALASLDKRQIKGEAPRLLLQSIVDDAAKLPEEARNRAKNLMACIAQCCDEQGKVLPKLNAWHVYYLEHALAETEGEERVELRDALRETLFKGEQPRASMQTEDEARLYRVLMGADEPRAIVRMEPSALENEDLAQLATALRARFFRDGQVRLQGLDDATAQQLLSVLAAAENNAKAS